MASKAPLHARYKKNALTGFLSNWFVDGLFRVPFVSLKDFSQPLSFSPSREEEIRSASIETASIDRE